ncbi:MAG: sulfotransferase domain-containing protein [Ekhidna sp.]|uniref:sulfotransferase domain-containing protein n=1 Tax=Ekhidna sp. TaxID=2608089 RepID=UPI0032EA9489
MNLDRKIIGTPLFSLVDQYLSKSADKNNAVVVCGFWRSGTTFLMQALGELTHRRTFYEPFHALSKSFDFDLEDPYITKKGHTQVYPYWKEIVSEDFARSFDQLLIGASSSEWVRRHRKLKTTFYTDVLAKFVRSNLMIPYFVQSNVKTIWIIRHPGGVLSSLIRPGSNAEMLWQRLSSSSYYKKTLDNQPKLVNEMRALGLWFNYVGDEAYKNVIDFYFLTHFLPFREIKKDEPNMLVMPYEEIVLDPLTSFNRMLGFTDPDKSFLENEILKMAKKPSGVTKDARKGSSEHLKCFGWKNDLSEEMDHYITSCYEKYRIEALDHVLARIEELKNGHV